VLTVTRKVGPEAEYDRTNELILVLPDGRRCRVIVRGKAGWGEVRVAIDAPDDVRIWRGEIDPGAGSEGRR
jgi:sRNA-binding carbon storage regulator CsrA